MLAIRFLASSIIGALAITATPASRGQDQATTPTNVTLTALVGKDGKSSLECWALTPALAVSNSTGTIGALGYPHLGATGNSSYTLFSQYLDAGLHNAPAPQYVMIMTGSGELSFPDGPDGQLVGNYTIKAGTILLALDTSDVSEKGHNTVWQAGSSALQMPFASGAPPSHVVLHNGGCRGYHM